MKDSREYRVVWDGTRNFPSLSRLTCLNRGQVEKVHTVRISRPVPKDLAVLKREPSYRRKKKEKTDE